MKKHELLKYAYDNYQKGINFKNIATGQIVESTGKFILSGFGVYDEGNNHYLYSVTNDDKWAEIVTEKQKSILDGKAAIEIENERELELFNESSKYKYNPDKCYEYPLYMGYTEHGFSSNKDFHEKRNYTIISFKDFAKEIGIELPVFIMKSEDGVDLYSGMEMWGTRICPVIKKWDLELFKGKPFVLTKNSNRCKKNEDFPYVSNPDNYKAFSTKEAAEAWILEANKPNEIIIELKCGGKFIHYKGDKSMEFTTGHGHGLHISIGELERINEAFKQLNS